MESNPDRHYCPIFKKIIDDGLCWEVCYADCAIVKEAVPGLVEIAKKHKLTVKEL